MERHQGRLVEQLQNVQLRERRLIHQLQAENARRLSDLAELRQERDAFRKDVARVRKENAELQSKLEEIMSEFLDMRRERAMLLRVQGGVTATGHAQTRSANLGSKSSNTLPALDEEHSESPPPTVETSGSSENLMASPDLEKYLHRTLPSPPELVSPGPDSQPMANISNVVLINNDPTSTPGTQIHMRNRNYSATL